jgi:hypothetical protein
MAAASTELLLDTEVRWVIKGNILKHVYDLHAELKEFLYEKGKMEFENLFSKDGKLKQIVVGKSRRIFKTMLESPGKSTSLQTEN